MHTQSHNMLECQRMIGLHLVKKWIWCANHRLMHKFVVDLSVGLGVLLEFSLVKIVKKDMSIKVVKKSRTLDRVE